MAERKPFLLRIDPAVLDAVQKWADDELRSMNGQIEYILRQALLEQKRLKERQVNAQPPSPPPPDQQPS